MISMAYDFAKISMTALTEPAFRAGIELTRLDERTGLLLELVKETCLDHLSALKREAS
jgi:hypothetical protein